MSFVPDPYRVLGVPPGASIDQVKSAYRRLAKQYHPDAAGERALPRFLAIQAAYETLVDARGRLRGPAGRARAAQRQAPWEADADRGRATRDAYRHRRSPGTNGAPGGAGQAGTGASGRPGSGGSTGARPGTGDPRRGAYDWWSTGRRSSDGPTGTAGSGTGAGPRARRTSTGDGAAGSGGASRSGGGKRASRRATPGSTSYDEVHEQFDPSWAGAGWYGPTMGTYWTLNPREYADPRKHGPDYAARARRAWRGAADAEATGAAKDEAGEGVAGSATDDLDWEGPEQPRSRTAGGADWSARGWRFETTAGDVGAGPGRPHGGGSTSSDPGSGHGFRSRRGRRRSRTSTINEEAPSLDLEGIARRLSPASLRLMANSPEWRSRLGLALVAWPPIGLALAALLGQATGCAAFAAGCAPPADVMPLVVQPIVVGLLVLLPALMAAAAFGSIAALAVAVPLAMLLSAAGGPTGSGDARRAILLVVVVGAYVIAFGIAALARGNAVATASPPDGSEP